MCPENEQCFQGTPTLRDKHPFLWKVVTSKSDFQNPGCIWYKCQEQQEKFLFQRFFQRF
jgi:hypothetical protein